MRLVQLRKHRENKQTVQKRREQYSRVTLRRRSRTSLSCPVRISLCITSCFHILQDATLLKVTGMPRDGGVGNPKKMARRDSGDLKAIKILHSRFREDTAYGPLTVLDGWRTEDRRFHFPRQEKAPPSSITAFNSRAGAPFVMSTPEPPEKDSLSSFKARLIAGRSSIKIVPTWISLVMKILVSSGAIVCFAA
jgi:hypothetical protein